MNYVPGRQIGSWSVFKAVNALLFQITIFASYLEIFQALKLREL